MRSSSHPQPRLADEHDRDDRVDAAARAFLETVLFEAKYRRAGSNFLETARGVDQGAVIHRAAERLGRQNPSRIDQLRRAAWADAGRIFGWIDISTTEPRGKA
jgi:hypothetical protein